jgi:hypothetical protein
MIKRLLLNMVTLLGVSSSGGITSLIPHAVLANPGMELTVHSNRIEFRV